MDLSKLVETGLEAGAAVVIASSSRSVNCRLANNTVTTNGIEDSTSAGVIAIDDGRVGVEAADVQASADVLGLAGRATARARQVPPAPDAMPLLAPSECPVPEQLTGEEQRQGLDPLLDGLRLALEQSRSSGLHLYSYAHLQEERELLGTSAGVRLPGMRRAGSLSMTLKSSDLTRSVWAGRMAAGLKGIQADALYEHLVGRLSWTERQLELPPGDYEVILEPSATADMLTRLGWEMHARGADEERTVFSGHQKSRVGEQMYARQINLESDPSDPKMTVPGYVRTLHSSEYSSVFDNGLPAPRTSWIKDGVQQDLICPRRWAMDHDHPVRADAENLRLVGTSTTLEEMIAATKRALLVTSFWYIRDVDPSILLLTGLTRDGVFLIENGEVVGSVNNFRFNESPVRVLARTTEMGQAELALSRETGDSIFVEAPPIRVEGFHMSSVSDAI